MAILDERLKLWSYFKKQHEKLYIGYLNIMSRIYCIKEKKENRKHRSNTC